MPLIPALDPNRRAVREAFAFARRAIEPEPENPYADVATMAPVSYTSLSNIQQNSRVSGLGGTINGTSILAQRQRHTIQVIAASTSSVSILAALVAIYWFCMMRRNYRRDLILLLIMGDLWKSMWYLIYGAVTFTYGQVVSGSNFCEASGYMLQVGLASCDAAILLISLHMALQIFPPARSMLGHDGLYRIRHWVYAAWIIYPNMTAALAFINPTNPYAAQGAFCWLPIRPFWYRLALSWIPRYLVWFYIMFVAIRIYHHVGYEFKVFGQERDKSSSIGITAQSSVDRKMAAAEAQRRSIMTSDGVDEKEEEDESVAPDDMSMRKSGLASSKPNRDVARDTSFNAARRQSVPSWPTTFGGVPGERASPLPASRSNPPSRRGSRQIAPGVWGEDFFPPPISGPGQHHGSISSIGSLTRSLTAASLDGTHGLPAIEEGRNSESAPSTLPSNVADQAMQQRRRAITRQLRLLFIYPVVYILLWTIPFVSHCMSYSDYWAQHPIFAISAMSNFCITFLGFADVCVFSWREKPWRHIAGSDGTFIGSFCFWRFCTNPDWIRRQSRAQSETTPVVEKEKTQSQAGLLGSVSFKRWSTSRKTSNQRTSTSSSRPVSHRRAASGGSDRHVMQAERAAERLALERADYERQHASLQERRASVISQLQPQQQQPGTKDWFDRRLSEELLTAEEKK